MLPIKSKKDTSKCTVHFRFTETRFKTRDLISYWYYLMSAMQIVANEIARFKPLNLLVVWKFFYETSAREDKSEFFKEQKNKLNVNQTPICTVILLGICWLSFTFLYNFSLIHVIMYMKCTVG